MKMIKLCMHINQNQERAICIKGLTTVAKMMSKNAIKGAVGSHFRSEYGVMSLTHLIFCSNDIMGLTRAIMLCCLGVVDG